MSTGHLHPPTRLLSCAVFSCVAYTTTQPWLAGAPLAAAAAPPGGIRVCCVRKAAGSWTAALSLGGAHTAGGNGCGGDAGWGVLFDAMPCGDGVWCGGVGVFLGRCLGRATCLFHGQLVKVAACLFLVSACMLRWRRVSLLILAAWRHRPGFLYSSLISGEREGRERERKNEVLAHSPSRFCGTEYCVLPSAAQSNSDA